MLKQNYFSWKKLACKKRTGERERERERETEKWLPTNLKKSAKLKKNFEKRIKNSSYPLNFKNCFIVIEAKRTGSKYQADVPKTQNPKIKKKIDWNFEEITLNSAVYL